jgi:putative addiction module killer protein
MRDNRPIDSDTQMLSCASHTLQFRSVLARLTFVSHGLHYGYARADDGGVPGLDQFAQRPRRARSRSGSCGSAGAWKSRPASGLTDGVCELKVDFGPGYRVYYTERAGVLVVLLAGGDKSSQRQDRHLIG